MLFSEPRQFRCKILRLSLLKVLLAARLNHVCCFNSLSQDCFPDIIVNLLSVYFFVKHSAGTLLLTTLTISLKDIVLKLFRILLRT